MNNDWLNEKKKYIKIKSTYGVSFVMKDDYMNCQFSCTKKDGVIETTPGVDNITYFRNKLFNALNLPKSQQNVRTQ